MAMNLQQQPATSLRLGAVCKPALSSFHRVSVSLPFKPIKQSILVTITQTNKKCPFFKDPIFVTAETHKNPFFVRCSNRIPDPFPEGPYQVDLIDSVDSRTKSYRVLNDETEEAVSEIISMMSKQQIGCASALNQIEGTRRGKVISRRLLHSFVRYLDYKQRYQDALEVYEWMSNKEKRYKFMTPADINTQMYLIAKVHGVSSAEEYLLNLPDTSKNKELYHVLLVRYAVAKRVIKAESFFDEMRNRGYGYASPFNVMMMLYKEIKRYDKIRLMISKMIEENISLDVSSYRIWMWVCQTKECHDKLLEHVKQETNFDIVKDVLLHLYVFYLDSKHIEKAGECVKLLEGRYMNEKSSKYNYLAYVIIDSYLQCGETREVLLAWETNSHLREIFFDSDDLHVIWRLLCLRDVEGAENIYDEWVSRGPTNRITSKANNFLKQIVGRGFSEKVEPFVNKMIKSGVIPNLRTLEILTENNMKLRWISKALSYLHERLQESHKCEGYRYIIRGIIKICEEEGDIKICEEEGDTASTDVLFILLKERGLNVKV